MGMTRAKVTYRPPRSLGGQKHKGDLAFASRSCPRPGRAWPESLHRNQSLPTGDSDRLVQRRLPSLRRWPHKSFRRRVHETAAIVSRTYLLLPLRTRRPGTDQETGNVGNVGLPSGKLLAPRGAIAKCLQQRITNSWRQAIVANAICVSRPPVRPRNGASTRAARGASAHTRPSRSAEPKAVYVSPMRHACRIGAWRRPLTGHRQLRRARRKCPQ